MGKLPRPIALLAAVVACAAVCGSSAAGKRREETQAQAFVDAHNAVRQQLAKPKGYAGPWTPLPPIAWSEEIALGSQAWAEQLRDANKCKLVHSDTRYGENLAGGKGMDAAQAVALWASEGQRYRYAPVYEFVIPTAHYTQVVWRKTTQVGCGLASCGKTNVVVCRYSPPGNHIGKAPF